jgi:hypothetical protein
LCIDVAGGAQSPGTHLQLWWCEESTTNTPTQQFKYMDALKAQCPDVSR